MIKKEFNPDNIKMVEVFEVITTLHNKESRENKKDYFGFQVPAKEIYSHQVKSNKYKSIEDIPSSVIKKIITEARKQHILKQKQWIEKYSNIRKKADFIIHDNKQYTKLLEFIEEMNYCEAYGDIKRIIESCVSGHAATKTKYRVRNRQYSGISCN